MTIAIEAANGSFVRRIALRDDGDGDLTLHWNTYLAGRSAGVAAVHADSGTVVDVGGSAGRPPTGAYTVGNAAFTLESRSVAAVTVANGPAVLRDRLTDRSALVAAHTTGSLTPDERVAVSDTLVLTVRASGLEGRVAAANASTVPDRVRAVFDGPNDAVSLEQTNPGTSVRPKLLDLAEGANVTVVADPANDTYSFVAVPGALVAGTRYGSGGETRPVNQGDEYVVNVTVDGVTRVFEGSRADADGPILSLVAPVAGFGGSGALETVQLPAANRARVAAVTSIAEGSTVTVRLDDRSDGGPPVSVATTVRDAGLTHAVDDRLGREANDVVAVVDTSGFAANATFTATVSARGQVLASAPGIVVPRTDAAVALPANESWADGHIRVERATLPDGGFLVAQAGNRQSLADPDWILYQGSRQVSGRVASLRIPVDPTGRFRISAPHPSWVTVIAVRDVNGNGEYDEADRPYVRNGSMVADAAPIENPTATVGPTTTTDTAATTSATSTGTTSNGTTAAPTTRTSTPGFVAIDLLVTLVVVAVTLGRRSS